VGLVAIRATFTTESSNTMAAKFELFKDKGGEFRFNLKAANGEIIASSEGYASKASAINGIESVKTNAANAAVSDLTA
jgi:uncharacterized protein YegP (UPF0339 family)